MADPTLEDVLDAIAAMRGEMATKADLAALLRADDEETADEPPPGDDPLYEDAARVVRETQRCSTSWLQRKVGLTYARAARIVADMERRGVVATANPHGEHTVIVSQ